MVTIIPLEGAEERLPSLSIEIYQAIYPDNKPKVDSYVFIATHYVSDHVCAGDIYDSMPTNILDCLRRCLIHGGDPFRELMRHVLSEKESILIRDQELHYEDYCIMFGEEAPQADIIPLAPEYPESSGEDTEKE